MCVEKEEKIQATDMPESSLSVITTTTTPTLTPPPRRRRQLPKTAVVTTPVMRRYFSRSRSSASKSRKHVNSRLLIKNNDDFVGMYSKWAVLWFVIQLLVPISYLYICLVLVRELFPQQLLAAGQVLNDHVHFPVLHQWTLASTISRIMVQVQQTSSSSSSSTPAASTTADDVTAAAAAVNETIMVQTTATQDTTTAEYWINNTPRHGLWFWIEVWCFVEALFYVGLCIYIRWLQSRDPLEASLSAAPLMELSERALLFKRVMATETDDPVTFLQGWFFDANVADIGVYDVRDFCAWCMFEGRHQEHLTAAEVEQLEGFVRELQIRISLQLYGPAADGPESSAATLEECVSEEQDEDGESNSMRDILPECERLELPRPKKLFHFRAEAHDEESNFFSNLYESYRRRYDQIDFHPVQDLKNMVQKAGDNFHPVKNLQSMVAETAQHFAEVEETARARATQTAAHMYESLVPSGSKIDKQLSAMGHATYSQLQEAWNSVKTMNQRLETARFLSKQRLRLRKQLKGYRIMLNQMREMSSGVPSKQMAAMMRRITECYEAMENLEGRAQMGFVQATGFALKNIPFVQKKEPQRFAKYSSDPILGITTYPLCFHLLLLGVTEIPLRLKLMRRGFEYRRVGPVCYYYHPGRATEDGDVDEDDVDNENRTPVVFVHGIGIGLISYMSLIDGLLESGRPIFLPEIPYVCGFRPWQSPQAVLRPAVVGSTMTAMLATHGYSSAAWTGHSYGTSWLSYMVKFVPDAVSSVLFLDPICFCLHWPRLTKQFVYQQPDPGTISYIIRTDVVVNWTIQRSFPWLWICLFAEQIQVPCQIFLSEKDALVPAEKVEHYLRTLNVPIQSFEDAQAQLLQQQEVGTAKTLVPTTNNDDDSPLMKCIVFRGGGHGDWTEQSESSTPVITNAVEVLCRQAAQAKSR